MLYIRGFHYSNASNSSIEPLIRNLEKRANVFSKFSRDFVKTIERLLKAASQCLCRQLFLSFTQDFCIRMSKIPPDEVFASMINSFPEP